MFKSSSDLRTLRKKKKPYTPSEGSVESWKSIFSGSVHAVSCPSWQERWPSLARAHLKSPLPVSTVINNQEEAERGSGRRVKVRQPHVASEEMSHSTGQ